jgi:hypothetical protein
VVDRKDASPLDAVHLDGVNNSDGMVDTAKKFSMADIKRFPSVTRKHFVECSGNGLTEWNKPTLKTVRNLVKNATFLTSCQCPAYACFDCNSPALVLRK